MSLAITTRRISGVPGCWSAVCCSRATNLRHRLHAEVLLSSPGLLQVRLLISHSRLEHRVVPPGSVVAAVSSQLRCGPRIAPPAPITLPRPSVDPLLSLRDQLRSLRPGIDSPANDAGHKRYVTVPQHIQPDLTQDPPSQRTITPCSPPPT